MVNIVGYCESCDYIVNSSQSEFTLIQRYMVTMMSTCRLKTSPLMSHNVLLESDQAIQSREVLALGTLLVRYSGLPDLRYVNCL